MADKIFTYNKGSSVLPPDAFRISPSQISRFFSETHQWYREFLLREAPAFTGNTMSHLGTCVHAAAEMYATTGSVDDSKIEAYIDSITDPYIDTYFIRSQYQNMYMELVDQYLQDHIPSHTELYLTHEILPNIYLAGSIDSIYQESIIDYKTTSASYPPKSIPRNYWFQQMCYVYLARMNGHKINSFALAYITTSETNRISEKTGKPLKDYPSTVTLLEDVVTGQDIEIIENSIKLIAESVQAWNDHPDLRHVIGQDYRFKPKPEPKLFKRN